MIVNTNGSFAALVSTLLIVTKLFSIPREAAEAKAAAEQSQAASSLPPEPAQNCGQSVANLRSVLVMCQVHASIKTLYFVVCGGLSSRSTVGADKNGTAQPRLHQIQISLRPSCRGGPEDSETPPTCKVWIIFSQVTAI